MQICIKTIHFLSQYSQNSIENFYIITERRNEIYERCSNQMFIKLGEAQ